jgi:hypothetical protein
MNSFRSCWKLGPWLAVTVLGAAGIDALACVICAAVLAVPAVGAELPMPVKAPSQLPAARAYDWTRLYIGGHFGEAGGRSKWSTPGNLSSSFSLFQSPDHW